MYRNSVIGHRPEKDNGNRELKLQDVYLNYCRRERVQVSILLLNRSIKQGQIIGFDNHSIILATDSCQHLIYKSAIVAIDPQGQFDYIFNDTGRLDDMRNYADSIPEFA